MKRRFAAAILACLMTVALVTSAYAAEARAVTASPILSFSGTTASCKLSVTKPGAAIDATLELWSGNTLLASWSGTGTSHLLISKTKTVTRGQSYTLKAHGTVGGATLTVAPVTKACP